MASKLSDIKALRLAINTLRRAELDYLDPQSPPDVRGSAKAFLFGVRESPLPLVCKQLGIDLAAARLVLLQWRARGMEGDPIFGYLNDPDNLDRVNRGLPVKAPDFASIYERFNSSKPTRSTDNAGPSGPASESGGTSRRKSR